MVCPKCQAKLKPMGKFQLKMTTETHWRCPECEAYVKVNVPKEEEDKHE